MIAGTTQVFAQNTTNSFDMEPVGTRFVAGSSKSDLVATQLHKNIASSVGQMKREHGFQSGQFDGSSNDSFDLFMLNVVGPNESRCVPNVGSKATVRIGSDVCRLFTPVREFYIWVLKFDNGDLLDILLRGSTRARDFYGGVYYASADSSVPDYGLPDEVVREYVFNSDLTWRRLICNVHE